MNLYTLCVLFFIASTRVHASEKIMSIVTYNALLHDKGMELILQDFLKRRISDYVVTSLIQGSSKNTFVVVCNNQVIGYCDCKKKSQVSVYINFLIIRRDYQNKGYATQLLLKIFDEMKDNGVTEIHLDVDPSASSAFHLYTKLGFQPTQCYQGDLIHMVKSLHDAR